MDTVEAVIEWIKNNTEAEDPKKTWHWFVAVQVARSLMQDGIRDVATDLIDGNHSGLHTDTENYCQQWLESQVELAEEEEDDYAIEEMLKSHFGVA